jgi:pseudaminic acid cytidylyltransferase
VICFYMNIAIIPARGGSKRIPGKNIRLFAGKPIIAYSIEAAKASGVFDRIIVSTDSDEIAKVAMDCGAEIPFMRPEELADDHTPTAPVIANAIHWFQDSGHSPEFVCCIYATAPFVKPEFIKQGYDTIIKYNVTSVFSITTFPFPIFRSLRITDSGTLAMFWPEYELTRSQDLPEAYHDAGQFYWLKVDPFLESGKMYTSDAMPVILPRYLVQDIDTPEDWITAEKMFKAVHKE